MVVRFLEYAFDSTICVIHFDQVGRVIGRQRYFGEIFNQWMGCPSAIMKCLSNPIITLNDLFPSVAYPVCQLDWDRCTSFTIICSSDKFFKNWWDSNRNGFAGCTSEIGFWFIKTILWKQLVYEQAFEMDCIANNECALHFPSLLVYFPWFNLLVLIREEERENGRMKQKSKYKY